jgi:hypothetical protein
VSPLRASMLPPDDAVFYPTGMGQHGNEITGPRALSPAPAGASMNPPIHSHGVPPSSTTQTAHGWTTQSSSGASGILVMPASLTSICDTPAILSGGVPPSSTTLTAHGRTSWSSSSASGILVMPASLTSIHDTARVPHRGNGKHTNARFTAEYSYEHLVPSQEGTPVSPLHASMPPPDDAAVAGAIARAANFPAPPPDGGSDTHPPRTCYCDADLTTCNVCTSGDSCPQHAVGLNCSGPCGRWFHVACTGWLSITGAGGAMFLQSPWDATLCMSLASGTQGTWYCIKCWEVSKRMTREQHPPPPCWDVCNPVQRAAHLGLPVGPSPVSDDAQALFNQHVNLLRCPNYPEEPSQHGPGQGL